MKISNKTIRYRDFLIEIRNIGAWRITQNGESLYAARFYPKTQKGFKFEQQYYTTFDNQYFSDINEGISYWKSQVDNYLENEESK